MKNGEIAAETARNRRAWPALVCDFERFSAADQRLFTKSLFSLSRNFLGNFSGLSRNFLARGVKWNVSRAGPERDIAPERAVAFGGVGEVGN